MALQLVLGIDLGSQKTRFIRQDKPEVFEISTVLAIEKQGSSANVLREIGDGALQYQANPSYEVIWPIREGVVKDFDAIQAMLYQYRRQQIRQLLMFRPFMVASIPIGASDIEKRAVHDAVKYAFGATVILLEDLLAATLGAGIDPSSNTPRALFHMGAGYATLGVFKYGQIIHQNQVAIGGDRLDTMIQRHIDGLYNVELGKQTAREIKHQIGSLHPVPTGEWQATLAGRDQLSKRLQLSGVEIRDVIESALRPLVEEMRWFVRALPADLYRQVQSDGVLMSGGSTMLPGIDKWFSDQLGFRFMIQNDPQARVIKGVRAILSQKKEYESLLRSLVAK